MRYFLALLLSVLGFSFLSSARAEERESAYDRIMRTGTIKCSYMTWPPFYSKDVNTGQISGLSYDLMEEIGKRLSLKIEWTEEAPHATMFEGFRTGRYDMVCVNMGVTPARARAADFADPFFFSGMYLYARPDDSRFDNNFGAINNPAVKYAAFDGEFGSIIYGEDFSKAQYISVVEMAGPEQLFMNVAEKKADVTASEPVSATKFMKNNPGKLKEVPGGAVRIIPLALALPIGEEKLKSMINIAISGLHSSGFIEKTMKKYPEIDQNYIRVAKPYQQ